MSEKIPDSDISKIFNDFVRQIRSSIGVVPMVVFVPSMMFSLDVKVYERELAELGLKLNQETDEEFSKLAAHKRTSLERHRAKLELSQSARDALPRTFLLLLVSLFDEFFGRIVRHLLLQKPHILDASERQLKASEILKLTSMRAVREHLIEEQIEAVLRKSHSDQFGWLANQIDTPLTKNLKSWPEFIEVTERRNLLAHSGGAVSKQYLDVCRKHGVKIDGDIKKGSILKITPSYLRSAHQTLLEIGVKLCYVVWRVLHPSEIEAADTTLNETCVNLITFDEIDVALELLTFATGGKISLGSEMVRHMMIINRASALNLLGKSKEAKSVLDELDWGVTGLDFKCCVAVIKENYKEAAELMMKIGSNGEIAKKAYIEWPVFRKFRETAKFKATYKNIFGEKFAKPYNLIPGDKEWEAVRKELSGEGGNSPKGGGEKRKTKKKNA